MSKFLSHSSSTGERERTRVQYPMLIVDIPMQVHAHMHSIRYNQRGIRGMVPDGVYEPALSQVCLNMCMSSGRCSTRRQAISPFTRASPRLPRDFGSKVTLSIEQRDIYISMHAYLITLGSSTSYTHNRDSLSIYRRRCRVCVSSMRFIKPRTGEIESETYALNDIGIERLHATRSLLHTDSIQDAFSLAGLHDNGWGTREQCPVRLTQIRSSLPLSVIAIHEVRSLSNVRCNHDTNV